jgi:hypothetical protein
MMEIGDYNRAQEYGEWAKKKCLEKKSKKNSNEVPNAQKAEARTSWKPSLLITL